MQFEIVHLANGESIPDSTYVLVMFGADEAGAIQHGAGVTVKSTAQDMQRADMDLAGGHALKLGLRRIYVMGG